MYCRLCGEHLYKEISFRNLFKMKYNIHIKCEKILDVKEQEVYIPIDQQVIKYVWLFDYKKDNIAYTYIEEKLMGDIIYRQVQSKDWSILYYYDEIEYDTLPDMDKYLLVKLCEESLLFLSLFNTHSEQM